MSDAAGRVIAAIEAWRGEVEGPLVVAIDGHGAAGKTTLAEAVARRLGALVVHTDEYFRAESGPGDEHPMARFYDWSALRARGLAPALAEAAALPDGPSAAAVVLLEGVSSAAPALRDLVTRAVFVQTPEPVRLARLHGRVSDEEWDEAWL
ncbi:MAG TPA: AAA family ATPase, partial [Actinospica sp.]|nr:AAA family ATPase [Actinospica sp.]